MKKFVLMIFLISVTMVFAQAPQTFKYQAVIRDIQGAVIANQSVNLQVSILITDPTGALVYQEEFNTTSNAVGVVNVDIGSGTVLSGDFSQIDWQDGVFFLKLDVDTGAGYIDMGTTQLLSVPFALYADQAGEYYETDPVFGSSAAGSILNQDILHWNTAYNLRISDVINPLNFSDQQLSISQASSSSGGYLSAADWNTFNDKVSSPWGIYGDNIAFEGAWVGIGINTPEAKLDVRGEDPDEGVAISVGNSDASHRMFIYGGRQSDPNPSLFWTAGDPLRFATDENGWSEKMRITGDGKVGIGTDSPTASLHVADTNGVVFTGEYDKGSIPVEGEGARMLWYPKKSSFRAGYAFSKEWDNDSIGNMSIALGNSSKAIGEQSVAFGGFTQARGTLTTAMGALTIAHGDFSTAIGWSTKANGDYSTALGYQTSANGAYSTSTGKNTVANSYASTAIGRYNIGGGNSSTWITTDPLFEIGNGSSETETTNALTVLKNGNVGIGTNHPTADLHVSDTNGVLFTGTLYTGSIPVEGAGTRIMWYPRKAALRAGSVTGPNWDNDNIGLGSVAMGYNTKALGGRSFAMGENSVALGSSSVAMGDHSQAKSEFNCVSIGCFNEAIGNYSTALGHFTKAIGNNSTAMGYGTSAEGVHSVSMGCETEANGDYSTAMSYFTQANGIYSVAMGCYTKANGSSSTSFGDYTIASGTFSTALGERTKAESLNSLASGSYNVGGGDPDNWIETDPLLEIGNGSYGNPSNAMTVLKNGNTGLKTRYPEAPLHINQQSESDGIRLEYSTSAQWETYVDFAWDYNFGFNGQLKAYIRDTDGAYVTVSDRNMKTDIIKLRPVLNEVIQLQPCSYRFKNAPEGTGKSIGLIAQEVEQLLPETVDEKDGIKAINYDAFAVIAIQAIKEQQQIIKKLEERIIRLEASAK